MVRRILFACSILTLAAACATNPATGKRQLSFMSEAQEISMGQQSDADVRREMGVYDDPALQQYVSDIGMRLARASERPRLPWHFTIVDQPAINAFALPGGYIYITRGILPFLDTEAQLAGVLGHEIGHVTARHAAQQYTRAIGGELGILASSIFVPATAPLAGVSQQALGLISLKYGRGDELQADQLGARYAALVNWDPAGVPQMLSTLGRLDEASGSRKGVPNWLSTHPEPLARVELVQPEVQQLKANRTGFVTDHESMLRHVDGLIYGDRPEEGITRGATFIHPPLRFRVEFPMGWDVQNGAQQVLAKKPDAQVFMVLEPVARAQVADIRTVALNTMLNAGFRSVDGSRTTINGLDAFMGQYEGRLQGIGSVTLRAAHIVHNQQVYLLAGLSSPDAFASVDQTFETAIRSFRPLTASEAENITPNRIDLYVVREGDTWQSLADKSNGAIKAATLAVMNSMAPSSLPPVGAQIKIVVGG